VGLSPFLMLLVRIICYLSFIFFSSISTRPIVIDASIADDSRKGSNQSQDSRLSLAKGIVSLVNDSQRALEVNFHPQNQTPGVGDDVELQSGLLDKIQQLVEQRETVVNTAVGDFFFVVVVVVVVVIVV
jgi:hypothetical protein